MDPPDVEMEPAPQSAAQPPAPAQAAGGEGWSMLSRARAMLEEGKPSLALQAVSETSPPLSLLPFRPHFACCVWRSFLPYHSGDGMGNSLGSYATHNPIGLEAQGSLG